MWTWYELLWCSLNNRDDQAVCLEGLTASLEISEGRLSDESVHVVRALGQDELPEEIREVARQLLSCTVGSPDAPRYAVLRAIARVK